MSDKLNRLIGIVGKSNVVENPDFISDSVGFRALSELMAPDFLVKPAGSDQVQELVKMAKELNVPLIPVSSKAPHRSGGVCPDAPGSIIVDLSEMNKILKVNRQHRLALVEPGVTWEELSAELAKHGLRVPHPLLPKKGKSVIASLVDREPMISPKFQWNMSEPLRAMEIIWGSGDRIYSGMGGHRGENDSDWANGTIPAMNAGPHQFDFLKMVTASQGTFGIVTWASVRCEVMAKEEKAVFVEGDSVEELSAFLYKNLKFRFGDEICLFNKKALSLILAESGDESSIFEEDLSKWTALTNIKWGGLRAKEKIEAQSADIAEIAQENGLVPTASIAGLPVDQVMGKILATPGDNNWKEKSTGKSKEIFFLTTLDRIPAQLKKAAEVADKMGHSFSEFPIYIQPLHQGVAAHCHIVIPVPADGKASESYAALYNELSRELLGAGAFYSRPYGIWSDLVYDGNTQNTILTKKMKDIFDPEHILNPGKLCF